MNQIILGNWYLSNWYNLFTSFDSNFLSWTWTSTIINNCGHNLRQFWATVLFSLERTFLMSCYSNLSPTEDSSTKSWLQKTSIENYYEALIYGEISHSTKGFLLGKQGMLMWFALQPLKTFKYFRRLVSKNWG